MDNKTQKKKSRKTIALFMCLAMAVACIGGGALAKYTTSVSGNDTATVAKWMFEVNDANMTVSTNDAVMSFDLFNTIKDTAGAEEKDVKADLIAPGTSGEFDVKIENLSEVNAVYSLNYSIENTSNIPLQFSVDNGKTWKTFDKISELNVDSKAIAMKTGAETIKVQWKWDFEGGADKADTALGIAAQNGPVTAKVTCAATFTQVD